MIGNYNVIKSVLEMSISLVILDNPTDKVSDIEGRIDLYQAQILELHKKKTRDLIYENEY